MKKNSKYEWKLSGLFKGIDPDDAVEELDRIENTYGSLTPENIVAASQPRKALFHKFFEWDDEKAANAHRMQQARIMLNNIQVKVISDGESREVSVYEIIKSDSGQKKYKNIRDFTLTDIEQIRLYTINELSSLKNKLSVYNVFKKAAAKLGETISILEKK